MADFPIYGGEIALFFLFTPSAACAEPQDICARLHTRCSDGSECAVSFFTITVLSVSQTVQGMSNILDDILQLLQSACLCTLSSLAPHVQCTAHHLLHDKLAQSPEGRQVCFAHKLQIFCWLHTSSTIRSTFSCSKQMRKSSLRYSAGCTS